MALDSLQGTIHQKSPASAPFEMTFAQLLYHLVNFVLPALALAVLMPLAGRWVMGVSATAWPRRLLLHALLCVAVLVLGVLIQGSDGQMATYAVLVVASATLEWALHRGWRTAGNGSSRRKP